MFHASVLLIKAEMRQELAAQTCFRRVVQTYDVEVLPMRDTMAARGACTINYRSAF